MEISVGSEMEKWKTEPALEVAHFDRSERSKENLPFRFVEKQPQFPFSLQ